MNPFVARLLVASICTFVALASSAFAQDEYSFHKVVAGWDVSTRKGPPPVDAVDVTLTDASGRSRQLDHQLGGYVADVLAYQSSRLIFVLGDGLAIVDPAAASVVDEFYATDAAFSPSHRFIAFTQIVPRWAAASALYLVYDVMLPPERNCMTSSCDRITHGTAVYPDENRRDRSYVVTLFDATRDDEPRPSGEALSAMHALRSDLTWISDTRFAFLDSTRRSSQIVLVDVQSGIGEAHVVAAAVNQQSLIDTERVSARDKPVDGRFLLRGEAIIVQEMAGDITRLRVWLEWRPYMKATNVDVALRLPRR
jgi:hypothetical protein